MFKARTSSCGRLFKTKNKKKGEKSVLSSILNKINKKYYIFVLETQVTFDIIKTKVNIYVYRKQI